MSNIRHYNQTGPFWDFVANLEDTDWQNHPFVRQWTDWAGNNTTHEPDDNRNGHYPSAETARDAEQSINDDDAAAAATAADPPEQFINNLPSFGPFGHGGPFGLGGPFGFNHDGRGGRRGRGRGGFGGPNRRRGSHGPEDERRGPPPHPHGGPHHGGPHHGGPHHGGPHHGGPPHGGPPHSDSHHGGPHHGGPHHSGPFGRPPFPGPPPGPAGSMPPPPHHEADRPRSPRPRSPPGGHRRSKSPSRTPSHSRSRSRSRSSSPSSSDENRRSRPRRHHHGRDHGHGAGERGCRGRGRGGPRGRGGRHGEQWGGPFNMNGLAEIFQDQFFGGHGRRPNNRDATDETGATAPNGDFVPPVDIFEGHDEFTVDVSVPGAKKTDIALHWDAEKSELNITGVVHRAGDEEFLKTLALDERKIGAFARKVRLGSRANPAQVDAEGIKAKLEDGVLRVVVPKEEKEFEVVHRVEIA